MAKSISLLTEETTVANADSLVFSDVSAGRDKRITAGNLLDALDGASITYVDDKATLLRGEVPELSEKRFIGGSHSSNNAGGVLLRYDDGYESHYTVAQGIHEKYAIPGLVAPTLDFIDTGILDAGDIPTAPGDPMTWAQLKEMQESGYLEIGVHGKDHRNLSDMTVQEQYDDLNYAHSRMIDQMDGHVAKWFVPPFNNLPETPGIINYRIYQKQCRTANLISQINERVPIHTPRAVELPASDSGTIPFFIDIIKDRVLDRGEYVHAMVHRIFDPVKYENAIIELLKLGVPLLNPKALSFPTHNMVRDPSFSRELNKNYSELSSGDGTITRSTEEVYAGKYSMKFTHPGTGLLNRPRIAGNYLMPVKAGVEYRGTAWIHVSTNDASFIFQGNRFDETGRSLNAQSTFFNVQVAATVGAWVKLSGTYTPSQDEFISPRFYTEVASGSPMTAYIDSLSIVEENKMDINGIDIFS